MAPSPPIFLNQLSYAYHRAKFKYQNPGVLLQTFRDERQHVFMANVAVHPGFVQKTRLILKTRVLIEDLDCHSARGTTVFDLAFYHLWGENVLFYLRVGGGGLNCFNSNN